MDIRVLVLESTRSRMAHAGLWSPSRGTYPRSLCNQIKFSEGAWREVTDGLPFCEKCNHRLKWIGELLEWLSGEGQAGQVSSN